MLNKATLPLDLQETDVVSVVGYRGQIVRSGLVGYYSVHQFRPTTATYEISDLVAKE